MKGFISYAHEDIKLVLEFRRHLAAVERAFNLKFWMDDEIKAGRCWRDEIGDAIDASDVSLLLCTPNFIFSEYIWRTEFPAIRERHKRGALAITVVLAPSAWQQVTGNLQAVPMENGKLKAVSDWKPQNKGLDCAREQISRAIRKHFAITPKVANWWRR
jgi:hypothetical protein